MSTTVSNPYSFNIVNNTSFSSPTIQSNLPQTDTLLVDISDTYNNNEDNEHEEVRTRTNKDGSQTRVTKKTINSKRSMTREKLQKLKEIAPNIDWERDLGNAGFDNLSKIMQTKVF